MIIKPVEAFRKVSKGVTATNHKLVQAQKEIAELRAGNEVAFRHKSRNRKRI